MKENMLTCAPIIIPTLNRKEHLARCLNSLANNKLAKESELFISVDYPPAEKYIHGYKEVIDFLKSDAKWQSSFKSVSIFYQEKNLGPAKNSDFLVEVIKGNYDRYIYTEDDNEFAPNFLEYINKCLTKFEDDENVVAICGCKDTDYISDDNILACKLYPAYGVGIWISKNQKIKKEIPHLLFDRHLYSGKTVQQLKKRNRLLFNMYISEVLLGNKSPFWVDGKLRCIDSVFSIYLHLTDSFCIVPKISKSRTWGNDGSGVNMENNDTDVEKECPIDKCDFFDFSSSQIAEVNIKFDERNYQIGNDYMEKCNSVKYNIKSDILYLLLKLTSFNREKVMKIISLR